MPRVFPACKIIERNGKLGIDVATRYCEEFQTALKKLKDKADFVKVTIGKPDSPKSENQRKFFHSLLSLYFKSGLHSSKNWNSLKVDLKIRYGWVFEYEIDGEIYKVVVSTEKYTIKKYTKLIDGTISEMEQAGIMATKYADEFTEIMRGASE